MTISRVTTQQLWSSSNGNIQTSKARLSQLTDQASSGLAVTKPSDDPTASAAIMRTLAEQRANTQYGTNIGDGLSWLATTDSAMSSSENLVRQAKDLVIQAANASTSDESSRRAIATQLSGIRNDLLAQANTQYLGRSVFAGTSNAGAAFVTTTDPATGATTTAYTGRTGAGTSNDVQRRIGSGANDVVTVSADGAAAFGTGADSVFAKLDTVIAALGKSTDDYTDADADAVRAGIDGLSGAMTALTAQHAVVGANYARVQSAKAQNATTATTLETQRSGLQDADTTQTLLELKTQELAYQTALQVTAAVLQPTLMSYLQ